jgi:POT family proton-dependent oligopeptide transporter
MPDGVTQCPPVNINVWAQTGAYVLIAISEIFASITSLEYAFTKAPKNMRSLVQAFSLFMSAISAAIGEGLVPLSADPLLVWNYGVVGVLSFIGGTCFWIQYRKLDKEEDYLNMLDTGKFNGQAALAHDELAAHVHHTGSRASSPVSDSLEKGPATAPVDAKI